MDRFEFVEMIVTKKNQFYLNIQWKLGQQSICYFRYNQQKLTLSEENNLSQFCQIQV
jgi:hypothetical protein